MTKQYKKDPIPKDVSRIELARFWDTHSIADYMDELKPVQVRFAKTITIRLDDKTLMNIRQTANEKGIGPTTFIRMVLKDYFRGHQPERLFR